MLDRVLRPGRNHPSATPIQRSGFTLAELLIVIAIIAVLISILLPTLGAARRSANSAKCLAQLRDIGLAFQQYAQDNKRAFPVVEWSPPTTWILPAPPASPERRPWQDFLVKYLHKRDPNGDLSPFKNASPLFGCPEFAVDTQFDQNITPGTTAPNVYIPLTASKFNTGYGMQRYTLAPYAPHGGPTASVGTFPATPGNTAIVRNPSTYGTFYKMEKWGVRAAERGLIADSPTYDLMGAFQWSKGAEIGPNSGQRRCFPFMGTATPSGAANWITIDGARHMAPGSNQKKVFGARGANMLFVDGHAAGVSPEEAWIATVGGGMDVRAQ